MNYSLEEQNTGTIWHNGHTIYKRSFTGTLTVIDEELFANNEWVLTANIELVKHELVFWRTGMRPAASISGDNLMRSNISPVFATVDNMVARNRLNLHVYLPDLDMVDSVDGLNFTLTIFYTR